MACCLMLINPDEMTGPGYLLDDMLYALRRLHRCLIRPGLTTFAVGRASREGSMEATGVVCWSKAQLHDMIGKVRTDPPTSPA
jgi:hypothetical protein